MYMLHIERPYELCLILSFINKIESVNEKTIQTVAKKYLLEQTSTTGWFVSKQVKEN